MYSVNTTYTCVSPVTGLTALDSTNLSVTFTAPSSGSVLVRLTAQCEGGTTGEFVWFGLTSTTASPGTLVGVVGLVWVAPSSTAADNRDMCTMEQIITGLSGSYTWYFAAMGNGTNVVAGSVVTNTGTGEQAPIVMEIVADRHSS